MYNAVCAALLHSAKGRFLSGFHMWLGIGVLASNSIAAGWGAVAWLRKRPSIGFWPLLRVAQGFVIVQVLVGLGLVASGERAPDGLHMIYGLSPLVVTLVSEGMRVGVAQRELEDVEDVHSLEHTEQVTIARRVALGEMGVMTIGLILIVTLALRAYTTGG
jgi:hypothetical protein